jgi:hypothetical protein
MLQYVIPFYATKTYGGSRSIAPLILELVLGGDDPETFRAAQNPSTH